MFLKIRIRTILLSIFQNAGYTLDNPLANYSYYDGLNMWLDLAKKHPGSTEEKSIFILQNVMDGNSVEKTKATLESGESYKPSDLVDNALKEKIESISDQDSRTSIMGASIAYKYM